MAHRIFCASLIGLEAVLVEIEADQGGGELGKISIVGLPDTSVNESQERIRSAIKNSGYEFPKRKITVNLAPAGIRKKGSQYDLPIALAILGLKNKIKITPRKFFIAGELSLSGKTKKIKGIVPLIILAAQQGFTEVFIPEENLVEASIIEGIKIFPISSLNQLADFIFKGKTLAPKKLALPSLPKISDQQKIWRKIYGQNQAKRAAEISLAGGHHLLMIGPPGSGKTMIAKAMAKSLPPNEKKEALEIACLKSLVGLTSNNNISYSQGLFRNVNSSSSRLAILGGGKIMRPGEISLSHHGILFLDEFTEFPKAIINALRQPMEEDKILISHAEESCQFPCAFILVAAINPCPCGYFGDKKIACRCRPSDLSRYQQKIPGPILDRFDLQITINRSSFEKSENYYPSLKNIFNARKIQAKRGFLNGRCSEDKFNFLDNLGKAEKDFFQQASKKLNCSERAKVKIIKIARTIADLEGKKEIKIEHLAEALSLRSNDTICYN